MLDAIVIAADAVSGASGTSGSFDAKTVFSAPLLFGADASLASPSTSTGFYFGWRPELVFTWTKSRKLGFGLGPYLNAIDSTGTSQVWLGGGLTVVGYFGFIGVSISGGADCDWLQSTPHPVPTLGGFVGVRKISQELPFDPPFGVRVDVRPGVDVVPTSIAVSASLDIPGALMFFITAVATPGFGH